MPSRQFLTPTKVVFTYVSIWSRFVSPVDVGLPSLVNERMFHSDHVNGPALVEQIAARVDPEIEVKLGSGELAQPCGRGSPKQALDTFTFAS